MLDATICDIYLVNDEGNIIGRPILTACIDAYSSLCMGYSLTWEGGIYSLKNLNRSNSVFKARTFLNTSELIKLIYVKILILI